MTPAINTLKKCKITFKTHQYEHDPKHPSYGLEAAEKLAVDPAWVFKTLVAKIDNKQLVVAILPVEHSLCLKSLANAYGGKRAEMADKNEVQRVTGYVLGGVSPVGQKKSLPTFIDANAENLATMFVSAGKRGLEVELAPGDLKIATNAVFCPIIA